MIRTPEEFVKICLPHARALQVKKGFHYLIPLTQAALESAWGEKAAGNNFFGIKDTDGINGNEQLITTTEYLNTPSAKFPAILRIVKVAAKKWKYTVRDWFRRYQSVEASFADHCAFFERNPRYKKALQYKMDPPRFFEEIAAAGYATAPDYASQLKRVMASVVKRIPK